MTRKSNNVYKLAPKASRVGLILQKLLVWIFSIHFVVSININISDININEKALKLASENPDLSFSYATLTSLVNLKIPLDRS